MICSLGTSNFLEEISSLSCPYPFSLAILLFFSISLHWSLMKAFLSLPVILWNSAFRWVYLSFSLPPFTSLLFSAIHKASSDNHFAFLHFIFLGMVLIPASCTMSRTFMHSSLGTLSIRSNPLNLWGSLVAQLVKNLPTSLCIMLWTFVHCSLGTLSIRSNTLNLFVTSTV